ncbi:hypothetical protein [Paracoccus mutanolyticus]|uniref:hypothetical protein n=1 Tax=Paracoccus mutanolyticus TaxID=1499308 RepID=UPI001678F250|nr:hypothetical protein [Paracoccus mutanolyticus]
MLHPAFPDCPGAEIWAREAHAGAPGTFGVEAVADANSVASPSSMTAPGSSCPSEKICGAQGQRGKPAKSP